MPYVILSHFKLQGKHLQDLLDLLDQNTGDVFFSMQLLLYVQCALRLGILQVQTPVPSSSPCTCSSPADLHDTPSTLLSADGDQIQLKQIWW